MTRLDCKKIQKASHRKDQAANSKKRKSMEKENSKEMTVAKICNGTVIDRIPSDKLFKVIRMLGIESSDNQITFGYNLDSKKIGKKAIIKIADRFLEKNEVDKVALIAPHAKIAIIKDYNVIDKIQLELPHEITGYIKCLNPKCITNNEPMYTKFTAVDRAQGTFKCHYCERMIKTEDMVVE